MRILRTSDVCSRLGVSRATFYRNIAGDPTFPKARRITASVAGWIDSEVDRWIEQRPVKAGGGVSDGEK